MPQRFIRYRVKPEKIEENQQLLEEVFRELHTKSPNGVRYLVLELSDGSFCHLVDDASRVIPGLSAFAAFQRGGEDSALNSRNSSRRPSSEITVCSPMREVGKAWIMLPEAPQRMSR